MNPQSLSIIGAGASPEVSTPAPPPKRQEIITLNKVKTVAQQVKEFGKYLGKQTRGKGFPVHEHYQLDSVTVGTITYYQGKINKVTFSYRM